MVNWVSSWGLTVGLYPPLDLLTDLDHEALPGEGVVVEKYASDVADDLAQAAEQHAGHEAPATPSKAEVRVDDANNGKQDEENNVAGKRGAVLVDTPFNRT